LGWENIADGRVKVFRLNTFAAGMLYEPFVKELAEQLSTEIELSTNSSNQKS
jgi:hypothetical protein